MSYSAHSWEPSRRGESQDGCYNPIMRKKEREIVDPERLDELLSSARTVRVGMAMGNEPYVVPLSFGYDPVQQQLFVHTAKEGRKIDFVEANPRVCFEVEGHVAPKEAEEQGCAWGLAFESIIGYGNMREITEEEARVAALRVFMRQQAGRDAEWTFVPKVLAMTRVWAIEIESMTGKSSI